MSIMNFGGIEEKYSSYGPAPVVILPVPYDATSTWIRGADRGPDAILEASANMELYDIQTNREVYLEGIHTADPVGLTGDPEIMVEEVQVSVASILNDQKFPVIIGGNHSVSIGAIRACAARYGNITVLQLDAHTDLRPEYEGSPLSHASIMARAAEVADIVQVGIRSMCTDELPFLQSGRIFYAYDIAGKNDWYESADRLLTGPVYITIDLDVFDPSVLPSTGTPEPGGLLYYEVYRFLDYVIRRHQIIALDVVELCPDSNEKSSDFLASKLIYQLISLISK
ncbi:MAG: agmatinase [Porphyromonadaceae bacterium]|nr:MAG: agmatinase [Porphyromonadaceae bacterium]